MDELKRVICEKRTYSRDFDTHDHNYGQLLFPLQGSMHIQTNQQALQLKTDHCFYLPPRCPHTFRAIERNEFLIMDIPKHYISKGDPNSVGVYMDMNDHWTSIRYLLLEEIHNKETSSATALTHLGQFIGHTLNKQLYRSIQYIHEHYASGITVDELAKIEHYHPAYYPAWFKKMTGQSPTTYIHHVRLKEAKRLLRETEWSITAISHEVGYEHPSSFTRLFIRYEGVSPQTYRKTFK